MLAEAMRPAPGERFALTGPTGIMRGQDGDPDLSDDTLTLLFSSTRQGGASQNDLPDDAVLPVAARTDGRFGHVGILVARGGYRSDIPAMFERTIVLAVAVLVSACADEIEVQVVWDDIPATIDRVTISGLVAVDEAASTAEVFPLVQTIAPSEVAFGLAAFAYYRGLLVAEAYGDEPGPNGTRILTLRSATGLDALRPCDSDDECATGLCGPKATASPSLWACVTTCTVNASACPIGSTCDMPTGVCAPECTQDVDCHRRADTDPFTISAWVCGGEGRCTVGS